MSFRLSYPGVTASMDEWVSFLMDHHPMDTIELGLERVKEVAKRLDVQDLGRTRVITVAGTNGKGSTCRFLEAILIEAGYRVGLYSSPHFVHFCERIRLQEQDIDPQSMARALTQVAQAQHDTPLTFFEFTTLAAFCVFKELSLDVVILEVGLGGRLDATNVIDADLGVLTSIGLDHQAYLGNTLEQIGYEKAGIFRPNKPAIVGAFDAPDTVFQQIQQIGAHLVCAGQDFYSEPAGALWSYHGVYRHLKHLPSLQLHPQNACTALAALEQLEPQLSSDALVRGLKRAELPGRLEWLQREPHILVDVAHNIQAVAHLKQWIDNLAIQGRCYAILGMVQDKPVAQVMALLESTFDAWYLVDLTTSRTANMASYAQNTKQPVQSFKHIKEAWSLLKYDLQSQDLVVVFGSFYTVAEFKTIFL